MNAHDEKGSTQARTDKIRTIDELIKLRETQGLVGPYSPNAYPFIEGMKAFEKFDVSHPLASTDALFIICRVRSGTHPDNGDIPLQVTRVEGKAEDLVQAVYSTLQDNPSLIPIFHNALAKMRVQKMESVFDLLNKHFGQKGKEAGNE